VTEGLEVGKLDHDDWAAIIAFREGVRAAAAANNGYGLDTDAIAALRGAIDRLGFTIRATADTSLEVASTTPAGQALAPPGRHPHGRTNRRILDAGQGLRPGHLPMAVLRHHPQPVPDLVHQHHLRQQRKSQAGLPPPAPARQA
jgi:hypothetical protein